MMNKILNALALSGTLALVPSGLSQKTDVSITGIRSGVHDVIYKKNTNINGFIQQQLSKTQLDDDTKQEVVAIFSDESVQKEIYNLYKKNTAWGLDKILMALFSVVLYFLAYVGNIKTVQAGHRTSTLTYLSFGFSSSIALSLSGIEPGTFVLLESAIFSSYIAYKNNSNIRNKRTVEDKTRKSFLDFFENFDSPVVMYDKNDKPTFWNKKMEEETGYSFQEVNDYYETHGEVMTLLYSGDELEKVKKYIGQLEHTGMGYKNVAFTMTTKSGEHKTFLWTTQPDGYGGTIRIAKRLTDELEIKKELNETLEILVRTDTLTGALNRKAYEDDIKLLSSHCERRNQMGKLVFAIIDVDNFKTINDSFGHEAGDEVLKTFTLLIHNNIRSGDTLYRIGGDEFLMIFKTNEIELILNKMNQIREMLFHQRFFFGKKVVTGIGTSWGAKLVDVSQFGKYDEPQREQKMANITSDIDQYMYAVKHLVYIKDELLKRGIDSSYIVGKNAIGYPIFQDDIFLGVRVVNTNWEIYVSKAELDLIVSRKQEEALKKLK